MENPGNIIICSDGTDNLVSYASRIYNKKMQQENRSRIQTNLLPQMRTLLHRGMGHSGLPGLFPRQKVL